MRKVVFGAALVLLSVSAAASNVAFGACYEVGDIQGTSYLKGDRFQAASDSLPGTFKIHLNGENSRIEGSSGMTCIQATSSVVQCFAQDEAGRFVGESWNLDFVTRTVFYTKNMSGYGPHDGSRAMAGTILGSCN